MRQAVNQLERAGLTVAEIIYKPDMTSTDYVLQQYVDNTEILPTTKRKCYVGTGVTLVVSYRYEEQRAYAPRLTGLSLQQAKGALWDNGLNVARVVYDDSIEDIVSQRKAKVYSQSPKLGTAMSRGDEVTIYLSCDERLIDSMNVVAQQEQKAFEKQRREAMEEPADSLNNESEFYE